MKLGILLILLLYGCATPYDTEPPPDPGELEGFSVLVFSKIAGFRHPSIKDGVSAIQSLGETNNWSVIQTENGAAFNPEYLKHFEVVIWLNTTRDVIDDNQEAVFEAFIAAGGGYVGIHAASDTEYDWPWYGETLLGTWFNDHPLFPNVQHADVVVEDSEHPATAHLPHRWNRSDEWYNFKTNPRNHQNIRVLATVDESTYVPGPSAMGDHPIIWCQEIGAGRMLYSGLGHTPESYTDPLFLAHLEGAILWAGGVR